MSFDTDRIESIRPDAHQFVVGILWLLAIGALFLDTHKLHSAAFFINTLSSEMSHTRVPDLVIGFLMAVIGIILPYCIAEAFIPITTVLMNLSLRFYRRFNKHLLATRLTRFAS